MSVLVCGDLHGRYEIAEDLLYKYDEPVIFVGDYLDSYTVPRKDQIRTLSLIMDACEQRPNTIGLIGNHEMSYLSPTRRCSGWSTEVQAYVSDVRDRMLKTLHLFASVYGVLITHAGVSNNFLHNVTDTALLYNDHAKTFNAICGVLDRLSDNDLNSVGYSRGGTHDCGGPLWCDWTEFEPINGIRQVFGHTEYRHNVDPAILVTDDGNNFNIDCLSRQKACIRIHEDQRVEIVDI